MQTYLKTVNDVSGFLAMPWGGNSRFLPIKNNDINSTSILINRIPFIALNLILLIAKMLL
jgi:hypothetical protein